MLVKIYGLVWAIGILAAGIFYMTGNLNPIVRVVFGFLTFGTVFMGMLAVLPFAMTHREEVKH